MTKEFMKYVIPSALAMFVASLYVVIDGIMVGKGVGDDALAAVNIVMPLTIMIFGSATMFAVGGGALISKRFGEGKKEEGIYAFRQVFKFLLIVSVLISIIGAIFAKPIVIGLGATESIAELASVYLRYYALFCIPNIIGIGLNSFIRNDGNPKLAMIATIVGAITNIGLDYLFIFEFGWGIKGAAIATGLGQILTVLVVLPHFIFKKGSLRFGNVKLEKEIIIQFTKIGLPSFLAEAAFSVIIFIHNLILVRVAGEAGLTAFSIINYLTTNVYMVLLGVTFGAQPLISYNFGRKDHKKIFSIYKLTVWTNLILTMVFGAICFIFGKEIIQIFTSNNEISQIAYYGLNIESIAFFIIGINLALTIYYQAIEQSKYANYICLFRSLVFLPVSAVVCAYFWGITGVWISLIFSELFTYVTIRIMNNREEITMKQLSKAS